jgi:hypothetical protein
MFYVTGFTVGRTHRAGRECEPRARYSRVLVVPPEEIEHVMGCRRGPRLTEHLRALRDTGQLIASAGRLQVKVRTGPRGQERRCYVFDASTDDLPPRIRGRVFPA